MTDHKKASFKRGRRLMVPDQIFQKKLRIRRSRKFPLEAGNRKRK